MLVVGMGRTMNKNSFTIALLLLVIFTAVLLAGCADDGQSGSTLSEPEITVEYLTGEYADQLLRDGAEYVFGTVIITTESAVTGPVAEETPAANDAAPADAGETPVDDSLAADSVTVYLNIAAKEIVDDSSQPNGFYIADRNFPVKVPLAPEARTTFLSGDRTIATILTADEFVKAAADDLAQYGAQNPGYQDTKMYHVYIMNGQAELVLAQYIP